VISFFLAVLLLNPLSPFNSWGYTPPDIPTLSPEQEAAFERVFQWDAKHEGDLPAVLQAVKDGDFQRVKDLKRQGAYMPLQHAVLWANAQGHLEIVQWLIAQGAVLPRDAYYYALSSGNLALAEWWWKRPSYTRPVSNELYEPVIVTALKSGSRELVDELLRRGELLPEHTWQRQKILSSLVVHTHKEMLTWLTQAQGWSLSDQEWQKSYDDAATYALRVGDFERFQRLVKMGYPVQSLPQKEFFLIYAAHGGSLQAVQWLVKHGVPIRPATPQYSYLKYASKLYQLGVAPYGSLIGNGSIPVTELQPTALDEAMAQGHSEIAQWLTEQGAKPLAHLISKPNPSEHPEYHVQRDHCAGIQCKICTYQSMQVADKLRQLPYRILYDQTVEYAELFHSPFLAAIDAEHLPLVQYILLRYPEVIQEELWGGRTLLHIAVETQSTTMVRFLLEQGVDPLALDHWGQTVLDRSIDLHHQPIYNLLRSAEIKAIAERKGF
jgi:hypothetical protein